MITSAALFLALPSLTILDVSMNNIGSNDSVSGACGGSTRDVSLLT